MSFDVPPITGILLWTLLPVILIAIGMAWKHKREVEAGVRLHPVTRFFVVIGMVILAICNVVLAFCENFMQAGENMLSGNKPYDPVAEAEEHLAEQDVR